MLGYYVVAHAWISMLSPGNAICDVGCFDTPVAQWGAYTNRYTVDIEHDPHLAGVSSFVGKWLDYPVPERMDVITCLQVIEHLDDDRIRPFVDKLFANANHVIVSVPYEWKKGDEAGHKQDPISLEKFERMMGRPALEQVIVLDGRRLRLIARYVTV